jgi:transposase
MAAGILEPADKLRALNCDLGYYKVMHARAVEREAVLKRRVCELEERCAGQEERIRELFEANEKLLARVAWLETQLFGRKSERTKGGAGESMDDPPDISKTGAAEGEESRRRGGQPGAKGHGRKRHTHLPTEEILHELPPDRRCCPCCAKPFALFPGTEDSDELDWDVRLTRRVHKRARYRPTCQCPELPGIIAAPPPPKLIPKGMFSCGFWTRLLLDKFLFQRPLYRTRSALALEGLDIAQGTLTGGLKRIEELLQPLYERIRAHSREAKHWHMDETRWRVFAELEGKAGSLWWLWVVATRDAVAYLLEPTRSASVPRNHLGADAEGIVSADRYVAYKALGSKIRVAFCWCHVRRDFIETGEGYKKLAAWARAWEGRINNLFAINARRTKADPNAFLLEDNALRAALAGMASAGERELQDPALHPAQKAALTSLRNHWDGLTLFVSNPSIPMDNNEAERRLRNPVMGRKNYYGSGALWSGRLAASAFTIFQTCLLNHVNPHKFMLDYLEACATNAGLPPRDIESFLPWNLAAAQKAAWRYPELPP